MELLASGSSSSSTLAAAAAAALRDEPVDEDERLMCDCERDEFVASQLRLPHDACDAWMPQLNTTILTSLCRLVPPTYNVLTGRLCRP